MSPEMMAALADALPRLAADRSVRAVVLTGAGGAFCAGGDVKRFASASGDGFNFEGRVHRLRRGMELSGHLHEMPKPTLAVIPGPAAGAGLSLALACDLRIAADTAKLTTAFARIGLSGDYGGSYFLTHLVGAAKARELFFTGEVISGQQAFGQPCDNGRTTGRRGGHVGHRARRTPHCRGRYMKKNLNADTVCVRPSAFERYSHMPVKCV